VYLLQDAGVGHACLFSVEAVSERATTGEGTIQATGTSRAGGTRRSGGIRGAMPGTIVQSVCSIHCCQRSVPPE
jgi:hypothetical protein